MTSNTPVTGATGLMPLPHGIRPETIGFDFDGVIADIGEAFSRIACRDYGYCDISLETIRSFQIEAWLDIDPVIIEAIFALILADSLAAGLKPIAGAIETISGLSHFSPVTIITARPERQPVMNWLEYYCPQSTLSRIRLVVTGDHDNKETFIRQHNLSHFIDDRARTCRNLAASGLAPIVYVQPWNRDRHNLPEVSNWGEIVSLFDRPLPLTS